MTPKGLRLWMPATYRITVQGNLNENWSDRLGGMGVGALSKLGVQKSFVKEVSDALQPGTSALFLIIREANATAVLAALKPYKGTVYQTSLNEEDEESLRRVLEKRES